MIKLLTVQETAALLRVKPQAVYRMARLGIIPSVRIGRSVRFDEVALEAWLATLASPPGPGAETGPLPR